MRFSSTSFRLSKSGQYVLVAAGVVAVLALAGFVLTSSKAPPPVPVQAAIAEGSPEPTVAPAPAAPAPSPPVVKPPPPPPPPPLDPEDDLRARITRALRGSTVPRPSVVIDVEGFGRVISMEPNRSLLPASTQKMYTASAVIQHLGTSGHFSTKVLRIGDVDLTGTLQGDLLIVGSGDPSLTKAALKNLAGAVRSAGISTVAGNLYADESRYDSLRSAPGWKRSWFPHEYGSLSAFAVDRNAWEDSPEFYAHPAKANLGLFRKLLDGQGVSISGSSIVGSPPGDRAFVTLHRSPPISTLLKKVLHISDNFYTEMLTKELGLLNGTPSTAGGLAVIKPIATSLGASTWKPADGSGLSYLNRDTTSGQVAFLKKAETTLVGKQLKTYMTVACGSNTDGWYGTRLCGTPASGKVTAKLGAHTRMRSLSGYSKTASGREVWFSFIFVDIGNVNSAWDAVDRALIEIAKFRR
jgi:D-alanyl-D-alanine carboxypeptidase/D-alanyl-D-alanine-endopeptidase (penicillin-binding protein 4)